jgi:replicative DNA helicase
MSDNKFRLAMGTAKGEETEAPTQETSPVTMPSGPPMIKGEINSVSSESNPFTAKRAEYHKSPSASIDRLPPHSMSAEQYTLSCILQEYTLSQYQDEKKKCILFCIERFKKVGSEAFYDLRHRDIYNAMLSLHEEGKPCDMIMVMQWLKDRNLFEQAGGISYLSPLVDMASSPAGIEYYIEIVWEKYTLRNTIHTCTDIVARLYEHESDLDLFFDHVERDLLKICQLRTEVKKRTMKDLVGTAISTIEDTHAKQGAPMGITTGFTDFDKMTGGLRPGEMIVIAARPSMGKTSLGMNIIEHVSIDNKIPTGVFSMEMSSESLVLRMLCSRSKINIRSIADGFLADRDFPKITNQAGKMVNAPIHIDDESGLTIMQLRSKARQMVQEYGCRLFLIDYMQLLSATIGDKRILNRKDEVSEISHGIKNLAKELNVPVIILSQLNRELEKQKARKPQMSDLRDSGDVEQDADVIGLLYKPKSSDDEPDREYEQCIPVNLLIAKQRNGPTGDVNLTFMKPYTRFENAAKFSDEDVPGNPTLF